MFSAGFLGQHIVLGLQYNVMGCQVVSVYHDEVAGAIGYPEPVLNDLMRRDYSSANFLKQIPPSHNFFVYGFTQSFAEASLYAYVLNKKQYLVYASGRFLVITDSQDWSQRAIMHEDKIMALDLKGKLCVTGTIGGRIIVWDLEFFEQKVNISMPSGSTHFSSLSLSGKYIFCTDSILPNNNVFCYDFRTTKLKARGSLGSFEPTLKGLSWGANHHVTVAADGVWFSRYSESGSVVQITKGMFRIFPKTSMTCLSVVDETYVISGSIDGYIFLWAHYQCQKAIKVGDAAISEMCLHKKNLIVSNFKNNVRVFSYEIKQKKNIEEDELANGQITEDFVTIVIDSYERPALQAIVPSLIDESIYYSQTRCGTLYSKMIPAVEYFNKVNSYKITDKNFMQYDRDSIKYIHDGTLWSLTLNRPFFQITCTQLKGPPHQWRISRRYISNAKTLVESQKQMFFLIPQLKCICYVGIDKVAIVQIGDVDANEDIKLTSLKQTTIVDYVPEGEQAIQVLGITYFHLSTHYLMVFFDHEFLLVKWQEGKWVQEQSRDYEGQIVKQLQVEGQKVQFENIGHAFRPKFQGVSDDEAFKFGFLHCVTDLEAIWKTEGRTITCGGDSILVK